MSDLIPLRSGSLAEDAGYLAIADIAAISATLHLDYRLVGGHMVSLLLAVAGAADPAPRETADTDYALDWSAVADPRLPAALAARGYACADASNRFRAGDGTGARYIDVLTGAYASRIRTNQRHGSLTVDEIPGLTYALARAGVDCPLQVHLSDGTDLNATVRLPHVIPALCLKAYAFAGRLHAKDAIDVSRLLEAARAMGVSSEQWQRTGTDADGARLLRGHFGSPTAPGSRQLGRGAAVRVQALLGAVLPPA